jgi:hypothetical protein
MKKFNLRKRASADSVISDKAIQEIRENMGHSVSQQGFAEKNINLSLPVKNKDNTIPFNVQLNAARKNAESAPSITEYHMEDKEVDFNSKDKVQVMDINVESQEYDNKKTEAFKKAEGKKDTAFWDKYVGVQLEGEGQPTKIKDNIPASASQLQNRPERFKGKNVDKMVMASIKDADAMLFHIYATATQAARKLTTEEKQQVTDINAGKMRILSYDKYPPELPLPSSFTNPLSDKRNKPKFKGSPIGIAEPTGRTDPDLIHNMLEQDQDDDIIIEIGGKFHVYDANKVGGRDPKGIYDSPNQARQDFPEADFEGEENQYNYGDF